jgi:Zn finger protein HypA/HybF involved in hydrogenase expression
MHDLMLAKEIIDEITKIAEEKKLTGIKNVRLEIGSVALAHDGIEEHSEDIDIENLRFHLDNIALIKGLNGTHFEIKKIPGENWKIAGIEVE